MLQEKREKQILLLSLISGLLFAIVEIIYSIYSHSQSALTDGVYDASELVFIGLLLFLVPLFHKPISEERPYGYYQVESITVIIKSVMMLSVTLGISIEVIESALAGGNPVNNLEVSLFQLILGSISVVIYIIMTSLQHDLVSPTIDSELLGWKIDIFYSYGMSFAFFASTYLKNTPFAFISPYFDQIVAVFVMVLVLPETIKILWDAIRDIVLFSPEKEIHSSIKNICDPILDESKFHSVFYDITKTGRHLWIAIYFQIDESSLNVKTYEHTQKILNQRLSKDYQDFTCELILKPKKES